MTYRPGKALLYAVVIWVIGFIWGSIVFMTPGLKSVPPVPYVSSNPIISIPILLVWFIVTHLLAKSYLKAADNKRSEGIRLGVVFSIVNVVLDLVVLVILFKAGFKYFVSLSVWFGYSMLLIIPWQVGRSVQRPLA